MRAEGTGDEIEFVDATDPERGVLAFLSAMGAGDGRD